MEAPLRLAHLRSEDKTLQYVEFNVEISHEAVELVGIRDVSVVGPPTNLQRYRPQSGRGVIVSVAKLGDSPGEEDAERRRRGRMVARAIAAPPIGRQADQRERFRISELPHSPLLRRAYSRLKIAGPPDVSSSPTLVA
jgi:hypothetical protein